MSSEAMLPQLMAAGEALPDLLSVMERQVPYASALLSHNGGLQVVVNDREQRVTENPSSQGLVLTAWNGVYVEEVASSDLAREHMLGLARRFAQGIDVSSHSEHLDPGAESHGHFATVCVTDPGTLTPKDKLDLCLGLHSKARGLDERIANVQVNYTETVESKVFANRVKRLSQTVLRLRLKITMFVSDGERLRCNWLNKDGTGGLELIQVTDEELRKLCDRATALLSAERVPPGMCEVICSPSVSGVIAHEAFGHGVELDMFLKDRARAEQYLGKPVASPLVDIVDDPSYPAGYGSYFFDDEGQLSTPTHIIRQGVFEQGLSDLFSAHSLQVPRSANGRRESFEHKIYARMSNTFFARGDTPVQQMIESVERGVYLDQVESGMEDPKGWGMQVTSHYGEEIIGGQLTGRLFAPVGVTGYVPDILQSVSAVGDDFALSAGMCGKGYKEWVPISSGGPHLRLKARLG